MAPSIATVRRGTYISVYRRLITQMLDVLLELQNMRQEMDAIDLANVLTDADFAGENAGLTLADMVAAALTTEQIYALINPATNPTSAAALFRMKV